MTHQLEPSYSATEHEARQYARWEAAGLFQADPDPAKKPYTITIPPPNITGSLHMGHALCYSLQDALGRFHRLRGRSVLILPGQDHAGIATQSVVDKQLRKEGSSARKIGREKFVERVWSWRRESGDTILTQMRSLGCGFDWSRSRFTLDADYADAVLDVFIDWFDRGLIFRGKRVVNWDPVLKTSVSDIETERKTVKGKLYYVRYPFEDGSGHVIIATTRPETMLGDAAVAVHPSDSRYTGLVGKNLVLPLVGRTIPLIADIYPDPAFGSGAVKITPAHDANDYGVGQRHNLEMLVILDESAQVTEAGGAYAGLDRLKARAKIVEDLEAAGFLEKIEDHEINIIVSERSGEVIEPLLSEQWFVDQPQLAQPVIDAVKAGEIHFTPARYERIFLEWMENIREWCISRQLWWGHRIPVFYAEDGSFTAAKNAEAAAEKLGKPIVRQDDDVLDTWFSSGLWPFATLGWPQSDTDLKRFYPTSVLVTDRNIINLWVARMAMMGLDQVKQKPFDDVMIYATVLTEDGRRMSKSLGTGIDPMTVIDKIGADALRFMLQSQTGDNQDIRYSERRTEDARNFGNKIWNAVRFALTYFKDKVPAEAAPESLIDSWVLARFAQCEATVAKAYETYDFQTACRTLYAFFWDDVCDWYIEISKARLNSKDDAAPKYILYRVLKGFLTMLHPVMPFITETLYEHLPKSSRDSELLMAGTWPEIDPTWANEDVIVQVERAFEITRAMRALRADLGIDPRATIPVAYYQDFISYRNTGNVSMGVKLNVSRFTKEIASMIAQQAKIQEFKAGAGEGRCLTSAAAGMKLSVPISGVIDAEKEIAKIDASLVKLEIEHKKLAQRLSNPEFTSRAKPEIVAKEQQSADELAAKIEALKERRALFQDSTAG